MSPNEPGLMSNSVFSWQQIENEILTADGKTFGQPARQTRLENGFLRSGEIVFEAPQLHFIAAGIVNAIGGSPVSVTRLPDTANVDQVFLPALKNQDVERNNSHATVPHVGLR